MTVLDQKAKTGSDTLTNTVAQAEAETRGHKVVDVEVQAQVATLANT